LRKKRSLVFFLNDDSAEELPGHLTVGDKKESGRCRSIQSRVKSSPRLSLSKIVKIHAQNSDDIVVLSRPLPPVNLPNRPRLEL
jgi:hypothetical protein